MNDNEIRYSQDLETINGIRFTPREIDAIAFIVSGRSTKKIASFLSISPKTVDNHIHNIM
ncbi:MAG: helix-turn-helix transcriptional regulator, partial [Caedimonadaceae bacterium]